ncbi:hypothetical protein NPIL_338771 [Nephila pilipes]|uniref:Uncharacterized protein n=1 Tax=Nephila pilipes TaxID=299642 RepID=A0A8X6T412_NEPPI|nr:hypothetical protein NPIL_338771 [Nephila pilipes]
MCTSQIFADATSAATVREQGGGEDDLGISSAVAHGVDGGLSVLCVYRLLRKKGLITTNRREHKKCTVFSFGREGLVMRKAGWVMLQYG